MSLCYCVLIPQGLYCTLISSQASSVLETSLSTKLPEAICLFHLSWRLALSSFTQEFAGIYTKLTTVVWFKLLMSKHPVGAFLSFASIFDSTALPYCFVHTHFEPIPNNLYFAAAHVNFFFIIFSHWLSRYTWIVLLFC